MTNPLIKIVLAAAFVIGNLNETACKDWCSIKCQGATHTMCTFRAGGPPSCSGAKNGLAVAEKTAIVQYHNEMRNKVAKGEQDGQPPASDMHEMVWDDEIAEVGQRWIEQCQYTMMHDVCRKTKNDESVGQNLAATFSSRGFKNRTATIKDMVGMWFNEVHNFDKTNIDKWWGANFVNIGHYTQLMWGSTTHVGCGLYSKGGQMKLACNYKPAGNVQGHKVYTVGETASKCKVKSKTYPGLCGAEG